MVNYGKPVWEYVLEATRELELKTFAPIDVIRKVREKNPSIKAVTIRCHVIGMTPNHPSSKHYPSVRKNHPTFSYLGNGRFQLLDEIKKPEREDVKQELVEGGFRVAEWEKLREKIAGLQSDIAPFAIEFLDRDSFKELCNRLYFDISGYKEIWITGYFSETIREELQKLQKQSHLRLICPEFPLESKRDRRNIEALRKLAESGVEIKFNNRLHARLLVAYTTYTNSKTRGQLILGSFDYNTECIGKERYDAGIKTSHPDLVQSAIMFFEQVWNDSESKTIEEFLKGS